MHLPFSMRPDLAPQFIPDEHGEYPFKGFDFLRGTVMLGRDPEFLTSMQLTYASLAMFGYNGSQIATRLHRDTRTVLVGLSRAYQRLGTGNNALLVGCLTRRVLTITRPGDTHLVAFTEDELNFIAKEANQNSDSIRFGRSRHGPTPLDSRAHEIMANHQLHGSAALLCTVALVTEQLIVQSEINGSFNVILSK
jgi:DNA-binding CsgD family transcriptional regulator